MRIEHVQRVKLLYKAVLKLNKGLPPALQTLGNNYVRDEFKRHKHCNETEAQIFVNEWMKYAVLLSKQMISKDPQLAAREIGNSMTEEDINHLNDEQIFQLYDLMQASKESTNRKIK